ncbi:MAG TPA: hypothetical protein VNE62_13090 [Actinomycetota bacterium]|nr:hypothetical protein [Actinomycetota bacterium]
MSLTILTRRLASLATVVSIAGVAFAPPAAAASADLALEKTCRNLTADRGTGFTPAEPDEEIYVGPGDRVECTLEVTNNGPDTAGDVNLYDFLPERVRLEGEPVSEPPPPAGFQCFVSDDGDQISCGDETMASGETNAVTYVIRMPDDMRPGESFTIAAITGSDTPDPNSDNNRDTSRFGIEECEEGVDARGASRGVSITGTRGPDIICGSRFGDSINGLGGADVIFAYGGNDAVNGGTGNDYISGGSGNDAIRGGPGRDRIVGGPGRDACRGEARTGC